MANKKKTRMYEPWGYRDENNYQGIGIILENDLDSFFAEVAYNKDDNMIHFSNKDGEEKATIDVSEFVKSDTIVERAWYEDGKIYIKFTNGDVITIDVEELIDQNEFADGLQVNEGVVSVLIDGESENFLTVGENGVKLAGVQDAINAERDRAIAAEEVLDAKIVSETERAQAEEARIEAKLDQEIADRIADVDAEEARATSAETELQAAIEAEGQRAQDAETALDDKIEAETARATAAEQVLTANLATESQRAKDAEAALDVRIDTLNDALTHEKTRAESAEQELSTRLTTEIQDRIADVNEEEARAKAAEQALNAKIEAETARATSAETVLDEKIEQEIADREADVNEEEARAISAETALDEKIDAEVERAISVETEIQEALGDEISRATSAETELQAAIEAEGQRAQDAETALDEKIDGVESALTEAITTEKNRAEAAEQTLDGKIDQEVADRKAEAVASAEYVSDDVKIYLKNDNGETLSEIDCSDFIVDGMIEDVELVASGDTSVLVITWNLDGGSKTTTIDVGDIFEADNYYTKAEIDEKEAALQSGITSNANAIATEEIDRAEADVTIQANIDGEIARATSAETALDERINNLSDEVALKANSADVYTKGEVDGKETALQGGIDANANAIAAEETRAEAAEALKADKTEITDMATKTWVGEQGFLTEHQSLEDYAKTSDVNAALELKADKTEIPTDFYTQEQVNAMMSQLLTRIENLEDKEGVIVADDASSVDAAAAGSNLVLTSTEAIQALTAGTEYNTLTIVGGSANNDDIKAKATDKFTVDGMTINGDKGASNGRVLISASTVDLKNVTIETGSTAYNVFEGTQNTADSSFFTSTYNVSNLTADNTALNHNIVNIYTPANGAVINIKDCNLNLDVDKSNLLRMANYTNATSVTINFENVEWTYENAPASDWKWAGLMIFQPSASDIALTGDTSAISTWTVNVKNCKYNGEKVTSNNFGGHNQVVYLYDINHTGAVTDADSVMTINFE